MSCRVVLHSSIASFVARARITVRKNKIWKIVALWAFAIPAAVAGTSSPHVSAPTTVEAGRYLVQAGGCNDCHTPGWGPSGGMTPLTRWLTGSRVGFEGPWGTTYPANLRLLVHEMSEAQWVAMFKSKTPLPQYPMRPPMPWVNIHRLSVRDVRAINSPTHMTPTSRTARCGPAFRMA